MLRTTRLFSAAAALGLFVAACQDDELLRPPSVTPIDPLFARYVSMGNSITAGFQSGGINEVTQLQSYAVLLGQAMRSPFFVPLMNQPGCPALYDTVFTQHRVSAIPCWLRKAQTPPPPYISNVAVPGAEVMDAINNFDASSNANALTTFFLGGLTQTQMMQRARPTFVSVWLGENDVRGAALDATNGGDSTKITPVATFQTTYGKVLDSIADVAPRGAVLIGVANIVAAANRTGLPPGQLPANGVPYFSYGSTYFALDQLGAIPGPFTAGAACAPPRGDSVLVPFPFGGTLIATGGTLTCNEAQTVQPAELAKLVTTVTAYNTYISSQASSRGWAYFDPNATLDSLRKIATQVAFFPNFGSPTPTACSASPFGLTFSCDAIHPSAATHKLIANKLREVINSKYATAIPVIP